MLLSQNKPEILSSTRAVPFVRFFSLSISRLEERKDLTNYIISSLFSFIVYYYYYFFFCFQSCVIYISVTKKMFSSQQKFTNNCKFFIFRLLNPCAGKISKSPNFPIQPWSYICVCVCVAMPAYVTGLLSLTSFCFSLPFLSRSIFISSCFQSHLHY